MTAEREALAADIKRQFDEAWDSLIDCCTAEKTQLADAIVLAGQRRVIKEGIDRLAALAASSASPDEMGWLIEHSGEFPGQTGGIPSWLVVKPKFEGFGAHDFWSTHDASEALRFARKEDAESVLKMYLGAQPPDWYRKPFSVTEHMWPASSASPESRTDERQAFEAYYAAHCMWVVADVFRRSSVEPDEYLYSSTRTAWEAWQARASSAAPAGLSEMNAVQGHEAGRLVQGARTEPEASS